MAEDDEFGDEIDWSNVQLPSISASMAVPGVANTSNNFNSMTTTATATAGGGARHRHSTGSAVAATAYHSSMYPPRDGAGLHGGQNHSRLMGSSVGVSSSVSPPINADAALRRQIEDLRRDLQEKDDRIFELEATAATSHAESAHRAKQAEERAEKRIHLVEEELRRTRTEAEKYRGGWVRAKKRAAELETNQTKLRGGPEAEDGGNREGCARASNRGFRGVHADGGRMSIDTIWGPPAQVEVRKVTPGIGNEENDNRDHNRSTVAADRDLDASPTKVGGSKRKPQQLISSADFDADATEAYSPRRLYGGARTTSSVAAGDSVRQRLARHLLNREEMGCYRLPVSGHANITSPQVDSDVPAATMGVECDGALGRGEDEEGTLERQDSGEKGRAVASRRDLLVEDETRSFVRSVLFQIAEAPELIAPGLPATGNLTILGLVRVLLEKFNSLFHHQGNTDGATILDEDDDHVMQQENEPNNEQTLMDKCKVEYQIMVMVLPSSASFDNGQSSPKCCVAYAAVSLRAAMYLLHVLHDILLLSGNARDNLRWCFYQSRQLAGSGDAGVGQSNASSPSSETGRGKDNTRGDAVYHPRIEGLPPGSSGRGRRDDDRKEALWTAGCHPSSNQLSDVWDPMTMARPCNIFFDLLVALMKGNVFDKSKNAAAEEESPNFGTEQTLVQLIQFRAIDVVLALMSDAPRYDHAEGSHGNRTPYLWKFWCDSLLPSYSTARTAMGQLGSLNESSSDTHSIGDFLSPWEKSGSHCNDRLLGSGRKHSTRLLRDTPDGVIQQSKRNVGKQGFAGNKSSRGNNSTREESKANKDKSKLLREQLSILIKSRILQLLSHFMLCSSSLYQSMHKTNVNGEGKASLAKRILAAVLDDVEETVLPFLSSYSSSDFHHVKCDDAEPCLQLCVTCLRFLSILSRSNEGIRMLRVQMRLESEEDEPSRWSRSAIACVTLMLDGSLSFAAGMEGRENAVPFEPFAHHASTLNAIVGQCVVFFKTLLLFVHRQRSNSSSSKKALTFLALVAENRTIFQCCCQRILAHHAPSSVADSPRLLHFSEKLIYHVRYLFEEVVMDEEEENREGK